MTEPVLDPARNLETLLRCPSVTPAEGGALEALQRMLEPLGFEVQRPVFHEGGEASVENLLATRGAAGPHLCFAGHTDVVPPGPEESWRHPPFSAAVENGEMWGRGAVDMKGGIACFVAALARLVARGALPEAGRVSFLVTGDEEGPAVNGTVKLLRHAEAQGLRFDACLVGEPTNPDALGDMIKIGRRGSLSGELTLLGRQGHVAYPDRADNPLHRLGPVLQALLHPLLDGGTSRFQPSNLEVTSVDTGNPSTNVVPASATVRFNVRFNDCWTGDTLRAELQRRIEAGLAACPRGPGAYALRWREPVSDCFVTAPGALTQTLGEAVEAITGRVPELSTSGGTSDARFIKNHCAVVEFGLVGRTMHMADERVALSDLETLTRIYETFIARWFAAHA
ncbi:succinyl-diaminopimelate desuccinylase [Aureimonas jatrophae]|uniref:Succinyl-diaminopimelate desuccinylase n=1 Tax=Aureimonas jatrophae TaxID=1166073 RepID=A0A1H0N804_9HYPH|nr:succinyl-diaminopimelate desuccinylase [Aureimonas jatrophae]MBB3951607.1 succinyl-diaminopimelate desuccinylase [Aureimonas jatrophae]SDO88859.1 succinyldiaminopimelate desuccinylase [Aureimonas jatrophae]